MLTIFSENYPIRGAFTISRGSKTQADVLICQIERQGKIGRGECVPYGRYGETLDHVRQKIASIRPLLQELTRPLDEIQLAVNARMQAGAARNAVDCALWDLASKLSGVRVVDCLGITPQPLITAYTLSLDTPQKMYAEARDNAHRPLLKIKLGRGEEDGARMKAVREAAPDSRLIVDANEGWTIDTLAHNLAVAAECDVALIEQPLPATQESILATLPHPRPVAICADESLRTAADLPRLVGLYDAINIKLDKAGGLSAALEIKRQAKRMGFGIMVGSMVATSLSMAPAFLLAQDADFVDLDGPLLLTRDRDEGLRYEGSTIFPPAPALWG